VRPYDKSVLYLILIPKLKPMVQALAKETLPMVLTVTLQPTLELTDQQFQQICNNNRDLKFERTANGGLVVMALTGGDTGERNAELNGRLWLWNRQSRLGHLYDSSTGFRLPNSASGGHYARICLKLGWNFTEQSLVHQNGQRLRNRDRSQSVGNLSRGDTKFNFLTRSRHSIFP
jgi:hypothetical protein